MWARGCGCSEKKGIFVQKRQRVPRTVVYVCTRLGLYLFNGGVLKVCVSIAAGANQRTYVCALGGLVACTPVP